MAKTTVAERVAQLEQRFDKWEAWLQNGLGEKIAEAVRKKSEEDHEALVFIKGKLEGMNQPSGKQITLRRILEVAVTAVVLGLVVGILLLFVFGQMTADDAAKIISALRGG